MTSGSLLTRIAVLLVVVVFFRSGRLGGSRVAWRSICHRSSSLRWAAVRLDDRRRDRLCGRLLVDLALVQTLG